MTSLLPHQSRTPTGRGAPPPRTEAELRRDLRHRRPLVLLATAGGVAAAASTLVVCLAVGVLGWFLTDAGAHGAPRDALRAGALGWLTGHGSGLQVGGVLVSVVPWGLTVVFAWTIARFGVRVGESVSGLGPDADGLGDGQRDWTVPTATALFAAGYVMTVVATQTLATTAVPDVSRAVTGALLLTGIVGGAGIAVGSGRAALWLDQLPESVHVVGLCCRRVLTSMLLVSAVALAIGLVIDTSTAANLTAQLGTGPGSTALVILLTLFVLPNAVVFSAGYLIGPGFTVGVGTLVSPTVVQTGALPLLPLLAALPDSGPTPAWTPWLMLIGPVVAAVAVARVMARRPALRWEDGAFRGALAGVLAGVLLGVLAGLVGGAVGPGRMSEVGPLALQVTVQSMTVLGVGGAVGGVLATWRHRRARLASLRTGLTTA